MANALAIAAVSAVLKDLINNGLVDAQLSNEVSVQVGPPAANGNVGIPQTNQINLFLYQVTPNLNWRNEGLPSHNSRGDCINNVPLALNLHYLLTAYGSGEFESEILLGYAMQLLHEHSILSRGAIRRTLSNGVEESVRALATAGLEDQVELIKITPEYLDTEAMSRLWSALQANYRISTAYQVSVVLIERTESTQSAPPVLNRRVFALPVRSPVIERVAPQLVAAGQSITLQGQGLRGNLTQVTFGNRAIAPIAVNPTDQSVEVTLPAGLQAGVNTVQIVHPLDLGTPNEPHRGIESNVAAFVIQPTIQPLGQALAFLPNEAAFNAAFSADERSRLTASISLPAVRLRLTPTVLGSQSMALLLNEISAPNDRPARAYSFVNVALLIAATDMPVSGRASDLASENQRSDVLVFSVAGAISGNYLVRVRVDGADSPLTRSPIANPADPMAPFTGPSLAVSVSP